MKRKITAILAADVAEYARLIAEDEEETLTRLEAYRKVFDDFVARAGGRIFNTAGDGVMCEFASAVEATRCAIDIQESLRTANMTHPAERQMHFRIGISIGDVAERAGDLLGDGVNIAARLQSLAEPGSICISRHVHEAVMNKVSVPFRDLGNREVKNLPHPVHAFEIQMGSTRVPPAGARRESPTRRRSPTAWIAAGVIAAAAGATGLFFAGRGSTPAGPPVIASTPPATTEPAAGSTAAAVPVQKDAVPEAPANASVVITEKLTPGAGLR